jgi:amino acid adenylation domain-containing protein
MEEKNDKIRLTEEEKRQLLLNFNDTRRDYPKEKTLVQLFEEQVSRTPDNIALIGTVHNVPLDHVSLSYKELNDRSDRLALRLQEKGVQPGHIVAIMVPRSIEMIVGVWGVLKAGAAYLPIDPDYPEERIEYMLADSNAKILLKDNTVGLKKSEIRSMKSDATLRSNSLRSPRTNPNDRNSNDQDEIKTPIVLDFENLNFEFVSNFVFRASNLNASNLAYVIYTSGSTGMPKGVLIEHRNVVAYVHTTMELLALTPEDVRTQQSSFSFDLFVEDMYTILFSGGKLVILKKSDAQDMEKLRSIIERCGVTVICISPAVMKALNQYPPPLSLRCVIVAGDVLKKEHITHFVSEVPLYNFYGPTETTVCVTHYLCSPDTEENIPLGKPKANYRVYILDSKGELVPIGEWGEIYISGDGVGRGYLNRPQLTAENFIEDPFVPGARMYRPGDLGRWLPNGNIEFAGRTDRQVKIRGFRIELGEIENRLVKHENVKEAVVKGITDKDGDKHLCAYIVYENGGAPIPSSAELKEYLSNQLPFYMIPPFFVPLESIPVTANGKVDVKALPAPDIRAQAKYIAPRSQIEKKLADIWSKVLNIQIDRGALNTSFLQPSMEMGIGIDDNFFELGGHSLKATALKSGIHKIFNVNVSQAEIFDAPTIRKLAQIIEQAAEDKYAAIEPISPDEYYGASYGQERVWILSQFEEASLSFNIAALYYLEEAVDAACFNKALEAVIQRHESLRTVFLSVNGKIKQKVLPLKAIYFKMAYIDLREFQDRELEIEMEKLSDLEKNTPFDLAKGPLLRAKLLQTAEESYILLFTMHHIISDFFTCEVFVKDLLAFYRGFLAGEERPLKPLRIQYKDYAAWQRRRVGGNYSQAGEYWVSRFKSGCPVLQLPIDRERPAVKTYAGETLYFSVGQSITGKFRALAKQQSTTLFIVFLTAVNVLLFRYTGQMDITVGIPVAGRIHADLEDQIGFFLNTLALRTRFHSEDTFLEVLHKTAAVALDAYEHQDYPFDRLVEQLGFNRDISRHPLFDVMVDMMDFSHYSYHSGLNLVDLNILKESVPNEQSEDFPRVQPGKSKFDLTIFIFERPESIDFGFEYNTHLFERKTMQRMIRRFRLLMDSILKNPGSRIHDLKMEDEIILPSLQSLSRHKREIDN